MNFYLAATGGVESAELSRLRWVVVARVLLYVLKLEQLDIRIQKYVTKRVGPHHLQSFLVTLSQMCSFTLLQKISIDQRLKAWAYTVNVFNDPGIFMSGSANPQPISFRA